MRVFLFWLLFVYDYIEANGTSELILLTHKDQNTLHLYCVTNDVNAAVSWITPIETSYLRDYSQYKPYKPSNFRLAQLSNTKWISNELSFHGNYGPIIDRRWEEFETKFTTGNKQQLEFVKLAEINLRGHFEISMSIRLEQEGHIYLCQRYSSYYTYPYDSNCYWIILGGFGGKHSVIRKCAGGGIPRTNTTPKDEECRLRRSEVEQNPLNVNEWTHITLKLKDKIFSVSILGMEEPFLIFDDADDDLIFSDLFVSSRQNIKGLWKIHKYTYNIIRSEHEDKLMYLNIPYPTCVSMYISMCEECRFTLSLHCDDALYDKMEYSTRDENWERIIFKPQVPTTDMDCVVFYNTHATGGNPNKYFWAVNQIEECSDNDIKISRINILQKNNRGDITCQYLKGKRNITLPSDSSKWIDTQERNCAVTEFSKLCLPCHKVFDSDYCLELSICDLNEEDMPQCYCSPGYVGSYCKDACAVDTYGFKCREKCGNCRFTTCNHITGLCDKGCNENYKGQFCKDVDLPIINEAPVVNEPCFSKCRVSVNAKNYIGLQAPKTYSLKYKQTTEYIWKYTERFPIWSREVSLDNLLLSTKYEVKIILYTKDDQSFDDDKINEVLFITSCQDLKQTDVTIKSTNISANILIMKSQDMCDVKQYTLEINSKTKRLESTEITINNLQPNADYKCTFRNNRQYELIVQFKTQEGVPSMVENLAGHVLDGNNIKIIWSDPKEKNGVIQSYTIYYQHVKYVACDTYSENRSINTKTSTTNAAELTELEPYSLYLIKVSAHTLNYEGPINEIYVQTRSTDKPLQKETQILKVEPLGTSVRIDFKYSCEIFEGPLYYSSAAICANEWCKESKAQRGNLLSIVNIYGLYPYSDYELYTNISRSEDSSYELRLPQIKFKTKTTTPNTVTNLDFYSTNSDLISIRWNAPYPPTGEIETYKISYTEKRRWRNGASGTTNLPFPTKCKIWTNMLCYTIVKLNTGYEYDISITVKNKMVDKYSNPVSVQATAAETASEHPLNLLGWFDESDKLILQWEHPTRISGDSNKFVISINNTQEIYIIMEYNLTYTYMVQQIIARSRKIKVYLSTINKVGQSRYINIDVNTPPMVPDFVEVPTICEETNNSVTINLGRASNVDSQSKMYVLLSDPAVVEKNDLQMLKLQSQQILVLQRMAKIEDNILKFVELNINNEELIIGNNSKDIDIILNAGSMYKVHFILVNIYANYARHKLYTLDFITGGTKTILTDSSNPAVYAVFLLLLLVPVLIYFIKRKRSLKFIRNFRSQSNDNIPLTAHVKPTTYDNTKKALRIELTKPIKISEFEKYVKESISNGELEKQHELFPRGAIHPTSYGSLPQNRAKNRYINLVAYDHTRVVLPKLENIPFSDYINASYIMGIDGRINYIATQGPKVDTVKDFWRMVWHENVKCIIMVANVIENGKKKTEQYWPNINEEISYGSIYVTYYSSDIFADYEYRVFTVQYEGEERKVTQLHFTSWPDHGIPLYPQSLVPFLRKMLTIPHEKSPMIIHCSAGVGRTGTILLIDICLRLAAREGYVDILYHQQKLREQRANMVDNIQQYKLVHLVLLECLIAPETAIPCNDNFEKTVNNILIKGISKQMEYIENSAWQDDAMDGRLELNEELNLNYPEKNRFHSIIPQFYGKIILPRYPLDDESSTYINAVKVDGFNAKNRFIVTQDPLPGTIGDFWRLIYEKESHVIVSLNEIDFNDTSCCEFWPNEINPNLRPLPVITLKYVHTHATEFYDLITIKFKCEEEYRDVSIISVKKWNYGNVCPSNEESLLSTWQEMNRLSRSEHPIIITCRDGATCSGLYVGMCFVLEKIKLEQLCDVCLATRVIRRSRKEFIDEDQFKFLYKIANLYLREFEIYSNFSSK